MDVVLAVYTFAANLPASERFELSAQMRRAAVSIPSNVAEGHAFRSQPRAYRRHVRIALGSLAELETQVELVKRLALADKQLARDLDAQLRRTGQLLHGLLRALRSIKDDGRK
jgi:four helix bundle protein